MNRYQAEADEFVRQYAARPNRRKALVEGLVRAGSRLQLNIPRYGIARLISERLRKGPFSVYYEFEKTLARMLHPVLADLNLNLYSDILVNRLFGVKYSKYARAVNRALAAGAGLTMDNLRDVILAMVEDDGHYMVVKFYNLVLRGANAGLFRKAKPAELSVIEMKSGRGEAGPDAGRTRTLYRDFMVHYGEEGAGILRKRMEWDPELRDLVPGDERLPEEPGGAGRGGPEIPADGAPAPEPESRPLAFDAEAEQEQGEPSSPWDFMIAKYAIVIKRDFLDKAGDDDGEGMRRIVEGMFIKNARAFGNEEADEIVRRVLAAWIADGSIGEQKRRLLEVMLDERQGTGGAGEAPAEYGEPPADDMEEGPVSEDEPVAAGRPEEEPESIETGVTDAEMDALTRDLDDSEAVKDDGAEETGGTPAPGKAGDDGFDTIALEMNGPAEEFLISDEESPGGTGSGRARRDAAGGDEAFLIEDLDLIDGAPTDGSAPPQPEGDFVVQDEILFEDKTLRKKYGGKNRKSNT